MGNAFALRSWIRPILCLALAALASAAHAERNYSAWRPASAKSAHPAALQLPPGAAPALRVAPLAPAEIAAMRARNAETGVRALSLGKVRDLAGTPGAGSDSLQWHAVPGGRAAHWEVAAGQARALRVRLAVERAPAGVVARFASLGAPSPHVYESRVPSSGSLWSPVLEGERAVVELFAPESVPAWAISIAVAAVAPQFVDPASPEMPATAEKSASAGTCEVDLACVAKSDEALARTASAVSRLTYVSDGYVWACTGTLLNPGDGSFTPYYYTAAHCIHDAEAAASAVTLWFYKADSCGGSEAGEPVQVGGGAQLLVADTVLDGALLRLNEMPPDGALYAGWDSLPPAGGDAVATIHHPGGGLKKASLGSSGPYPDQRFVAATWNLGVTASGSSGSGLFTAVRSPAPDYLLRGTLVGGNSACNGTAPAGTDVYSRFDLMWPKLAPYLSAHAPDSNFTGLWWNPGEPGWGVSVEHQGGVIMATLFGYSPDGSPHWYTASAMREQADGDFHGDLFEMTGPAFGTAPWGGLVMHTAGRMRIVFSGPTAARIEFTIGETTVAKDITPMVFGATGRSVCSFTDKSRVDSKNYQDLWWNPAQSGWGLAVAHQGDTLFAVLFMYDDQHRAMWLVGSDLRLRSDGTYSGDLYRTTGPAFGTATWRPASATAVGGITLQFTDGESGVLAFTVDGRAVRTPIQRQVAMPSVPLCG
jgi:hypothetical protein